MLFRKKIIFMHDNAPSHAAKVTTEYLERGFARHEKIMQWPACSLDLNPIKDLWSILIRKIDSGRRQYTSRLPLSFFSSKMPSKPKKRRNFRKEGRNFGRNFSESLYLSNMLFSRQFVYFCTIYLQLIYRLLIIYLQVLKGLWTCS